MKKAEQQAAITWTKHRVGGVKPLGGFPQFLPAGITGGNL